MELSVDIFSRRKTPHEWTLESWLSMSAPRVNVNN